MRTKMKILLGDPPSVDSLRIQEPPKGKSEKRVVWLESIDWNGTGKETRYLPFPCQNSLNNPIKATLYFTVFLHLLHFTIFLDFLSNFPWLFFINFLFFSPISYFLFRFSAVPITETDTNEVYKIMFFCMRNDGKSETFHSAVDHVCYAVFCW